MLQVGQPLTPGDSATENPAEDNVAALLRSMTLAEKVGQMCQVSGHEGSVPEALRAAIAGGQVGSVINEVDVDTVNELQRIALQESRLGIPLLIGRDVIHGFKTVFPIPLGQAATWNPRLVKRAASIAAVEAAAAGINWTFAPMLDLSRDPRWGRIAESFGEDPYLLSVFGKAMIEGLQGEDLRARDSIAACAKHFAGYGASESGRDYNTVSIPEIELRNVYLPPFEAAIESGAASVMTSFSELNGVPCTGNAFLLDTVLREEWQFDGIVVSDWESITDMVAHGFTEDRERSAEVAANAGVDMEMASTNYADHLVRLVEEGRVPQRRIDNAVARILRLKFSLGLFDSSPTEPTKFPRPANPEHLDVASTAARQSVVLLTNPSAVLPLSRESLASVAVVGPLADAAQDQLGTWVFDGDPAHSQTPLTAIREVSAGAFDVRFAAGVPDTRRDVRDGFAAAVDAAAGADVALLFLGEEAILSGEAHSRADISLPGAQLALIDAVTETRTPTVLVVMAGRPLALENVVDKVDAILYAWHPGTMAGPALADLLFGVDSPSGKLPVTFPRVTGQIPIYYGHKNTGRPSTPDNPMNMETIGDIAVPESAGFTSFHLDAGSTPLFCFGHGLSYADFRYCKLRVPAAPVRLGDAFEITAEVTNVGDVEADEVAQLYVRDLVASVTRPVRELKRFTRLRLQPGETCYLSFRLHTDDLAFVGSDMQRRTEPGRFRFWLGTDSRAELSADVEVRI